MAAYAESRRRRAPDQAAREPTAGSRHRTISPAQAGHGTEDELQLLCTHGILHLLGYDHAEPEEHKEMFGLQAELLASWREARTQASS